jgi:lipopolysaccharide export system protein LptC
MNSDIEAPEVAMRRFVHRPILSVAVLLVATVALAATNRQWNSGKLLDTERETVKDGSITHYTTDGQAKTKSNGKTDYSQNTTAHTMDNTDTYEVYTIEGPDKTYIAREKLLFPWSKPANVTVGADVKFVTEGRKLIILDDDQKEHKASIVKTSLNHPK